METGALRAVAAVSLRGAYEHPLFPLYVAAIVVTVGIFAVQVVRFTKRMERTPKTGEPVAYRRLPPPGLRVSMGALFVLLSLPLLVDHLDDFGRMVRENPAFLLGLLFPLLGVGLVLWGLVPLVRPRAPGRLELDDPQPRAGGVLSGRYVAAGRLAGRPRVGVRLVLQEVTLQRWTSGERQLFETPVWSETKEELPRLVGEEVEIPFRFEIPARLPGSSTGDRRHEWLLVFEGPSLGTRRVSVEIAGAKEQPPDEAPADEAFGGAEAATGGWRFGETAAGGPEAESARPRFATAPGGGVEAGAGKRRFGEAPAGTPAPPPAGGLGAAGWARGGVAEGPLAAAQELVSAGRLGRGGLGGQPQGLGGKLASLAASLFVLVFPLLAWFAFDGDRRPWLDLRHTLPPLLLQGLVTLGIFGTPVVLLVRSLQSEGVRVRRASQLVAGVIVLDSILAVAGIVWIATHGVAGLASLADSFERIALVVLHGFLGMFLWLGAYAVLASLASLLRGSDEGPALR